LLELGGGQVARESLLGAALVPLRAAWLHGSPNAQLSAAPRRAAGRVAVGRADAPPDLPVGFLLASTLVVIAAPYLLPMPISKRFCRERYL
jgi:hypothetical protein